VDDVADNTGFAYDCPQDVPTTQAPGAATLAILRRDIAPQLAEVYPQFAAALFGATPRHPI
jgi:glutaconate CoA-transferase subunit B